MKITSAIALAATTALAACGSMSHDMRTSSMFDQGNLAASVQVPKGHRVGMETHAIGEITYECRAKKDMAGAHEWVFAGPDAKLMDRKGTQVARYYGPPATWEAMDGSKITATQLAVSPGGTGNIPLQLVRANPAMGSGAMQGVTHVQRVATQGGVASATPCAATNMGAKQLVKYEADYIFWRAM